MRLVVYRDWARGSFGDLGGASDMEMGGECNVANTIKKTSNQALFIS